MTRMSGVRRVARTLLGCAFALLGAFVVVTMLNGAPIDDSRRARAWGQWHRSPSPTTEAAWIRERDRAGRNELLIILGGVAFLVGGGALVLWPTSRQVVDAS